MREIKFRRAHYRHTDNKFERFSYWGPVKGGFDSPAHISSCYYKDFTDKQYTGMKDRTGNEIYEGDIVLCNRYESSEDHVVTIKDIRQLPSQMFGSNLNYLEVIGYFEENEKFITP
jgi:hypothetical protein